MFAALFSSIIEFLVLVGVTVVVYETFLSDIIIEYRDRAKEKKVKFDSLDKIAQVKLVSDDPKDIEKFITENAQYLSVPTVNKLVSRIDTLHNDSVIRADDLLKKKFENLQTDEEEEIKHAKVVRS